MIKITKEPFLEGETLLCKVNPTSRLLRYTIPIVQVYVR